MQRLCTAYAMYARYKHRRPGHHFQGRFKANLVLDDVYLRTCALREHRFGGRQHDPSQGPRRPP